MVLAIVFFQSCDTCECSCSDRSTGSSLLPLVNGRGDPSRKDFITAQYHSVFSVTGEFMIRQVTRNWLHLSLFRSHWPARSLPGFFGRERIS